MLPGCTLSIKEFNTNQGSTVSKKILIVEDHNDFREIVRNFLRTKMADVNPEIIEATTGEDGVVVALKEKPDIILMDIRLPKMTGMDAASMIKASFPECKIIILTMFETETFRKVFKSDSVTAYIGKSELYDKLVPEINKIFSKN